MTKSSLTSGGTPSFSNAATVMNLWHLNEFHPAFHLPKTHWVIWHWHRGSSISKTQQHKLELALHTAAMEGPVAFPAQVTLLFSTKYLCVNEIVSFKLSLYSFLRILSFCNNNSSEMEAENFNDFTAKQEYNELNPPIWKPITNNYHIQTTIWKCQLGHKII